MFEQFEGTLGQQLAQWLPIVGAVVRIAAIGYALVGVVVAFAAPFFGWESSAALRIIETAFWLMGVALLLWLAKKALSRRTPAGTSTRRKP